MMFNLKRPLPATLHGNRFPKVFAFDLKSDAGGQLGSRLSR